MDSSHAQRIENERSFHNARFTNEVRDAQRKYYYCIKHGTAQFEARVSELARGADVLEYGCGEEPEGLRLGSDARSLIGIDISDVAIADANRAAELSGLRNAHYVRMDAESMEFESESFDLVFGNGIVHHLDLERCFGEISRVLRPGGRAVFWEPLGHNPILNRYRSMTPDARTPDEHPLLKSDFDLARLYFEVAPLRFYGLTTIVTVPLRDTKLGDALLSMTAMLDELMFRSPMRWIAWYCLLELKKAPAA